VGHSATIAAEVVYAVADEMALHLADVVVRRTNLGSGSHPGRAALVEAAHAMKPLLGWSDAQVDREVADTERVLRHHRASQPAAPGASP